MSKVTLMATLLLTQVTDYITHLSLFGYLAISLQLSSGLPPLEYPVILLGVDVEWFLVQDLSTPQREPSQRTTSARKHLKDENTNCEVLYM